jgi:hypothetical protein
MEGFPGGTPDAQQLHATMLAIEQACSLIQVRALYSPLPPTFSPCLIHYFRPLARLASALYFFCVSV